MNSLLKYDRENSILIAKPTKCPHCNNGVDPVINHFGSVTKNGCVFLYVTFQCPICEEVFICSYCIYSLLDAFNKEYPFHINEIISNGFERENFSDEISELSPSFVETYNQAFFAEQHFMDMISGMGYRRAFEFLIKDFGIYFCPDKKDEIASSFISNTIDLIFNDSEKEIFKKTAFIGNDQSHFENNHADMSVEDLKKLIKICVSKIETKIREKHYLEKIK